MGNFIFDNDAANDDVMALVYLASCPTVNIAAITIAGTGEAHGERGATNIANLCYMLGKENIPIAYGNDQSFENLGKSFPDFIRQKMDIIFEGKNVPVHPNPKITSSAVELIKNTIISHKDPISILATGPLTNIAEFIQKYPELITKIDKVVIMGGALKVNGNIRALDPQSTNEIAEWNIYADPKAASIVFSSNIPITLVPLDATNQVHMTEEFYNSLSKQTQPSLKLIYDLLKEIVDLFGMELFLKEFYLWDPLAAMIALNSDIGTSEKLSISVNLSTAQTKYLSNDTTEATSINVITEVLNSQLVLNQFIEIIKENQPNKDITLSKNNFFAQQHDGRNNVRDKISETILEF